MIGMVGATSALQQLSGSADTDLAAAAAMPQMPLSQGATPANSFADVMASLGQGVMGNLRVAETNSLAAVRGEVPTRDVVDSIMSAEQSLQTAVAIRDKLVTAYLEIARMQI
ncbi:flagellar hook-basal body complex protein FliE [Hoeflea ulvae]|uniref:Flagellar hook-basal body complex protein FliE n=1 Tax=Hoeflea ulvae TaxID=2983764 RepID=A0ABT3YCU8_9HYPH|nr:flagellar hook-basal body complex protein FliE [Hoeflea ulvae]MCY0093512.1 flagellar hook-basal body complex protein FliE [Hoeflea ulvae]